MSHIVGNPESFSCVVARMYIDVFTICIYVIEQYFLFHLSNRCISHFLVALVFRFDKVYVKIIGDAFYVSSFSFCLFVLCFNASI